MKKLSTIHCLLLVCSWLGALGLSGCKQSSDSDVLSDYPRVTEKKQAKRFLRYYNLPTTLFVRDIKKIK